MSRYSFSEVVTNAEDLIDFDERYDEFGSEIDNTPLDIKGYSLDDWVGFGVIGWDDLLKTYFVQLDTGSDTVPWRLGKTPSEIPTFDRLCESINNIFNVKKGFFKFRNLIKIDD